MRPEDIIEESLKEVSSRGVKIICGGALFNWCNGDPTGCDAFGAVLLAKGKAAKNFPKGWFAELCGILGIDGYWFWRFNLGFSYRQILMLEVEKGKKTIYIQDEVSKTGYQMAKKWVERSA